MKRRRINSTAWAETIVQNRPTAPHLADQAMAKLYSAFADLKAGSVDHDLFDRLASAINIGMIRAEKIDPLCEQPMLAARDALIRCDAICNRHGRYGFDGPGIQAVATGLEVYEEILRKSTPAQMNAALHESRLRMEAQVAAEESAS